MTPNSMVIVWTPEKLATLKELRGSGMGFKEIGHILGCTRLSASSAWHRKVLPFLPKAAPVAKVATVLIQVDRKPTLAYVPHLWPNPRYKMRSECSLNAEQSETASPLNAC